jgi:hypothetical protein
MEEIQTLKIAYLLRCADAIQIDQRRAPRFAFAVHAPQGESALHWLAQQLSQPIVTRDASGPGALVFTSQKDFTEEKADAWWIAHDLIRVANEELQGCYQIMKDLNLPAFTVDRVRGAESPRQLAHHIRTSGWRPVVAEARVTNVEQIIRLFGGRALYGRDLAVPLRELIQNAADAVRARRAWENDSWYEGKVVVTLKSSEEEGFCDLVVEDDGIGMSEHVLTGPLIEFGKSFWTSAEAQEEFPGLVSRNLHQTGRYGIGFFSTLMVADRIAVTSRRCDAGHDKARTLTFRKGLQLRPLISEAHEASLDGFSTRVELHITSKLAEQLLTVSQAPPSNLNVTLSQLVAHLCPCLDCNVWVAQPPSQPKLAHSATWHQADALPWIREIVFAEPRAKQDIDTYLAQIAPLIRVLKRPDGVPCGRAAIGFGLIEAGIQSVGGLASSQAVQNFSMAYVGAMGFEPEGPRRNAGFLLGAIEAWASEQAGLVAQIEISAFEKYLAAMNVAAFGGDPTQIAMVLLNRKPTPLASVYDMLAAGKPIFAAVDASLTGLKLSMVFHRSGPSFRQSFGWNELDFAVDTIEAWSGSRSPDERYHSVPTEEVPVPSSVLSCLKRYAQSQARTLQWDVESNVLCAHYKGEASPRDKLSVGDELRTTALKLSLG